MRYAASVSDDIQSFILGLQVFIDLDLHVIEFDFHTIEQRIIVCRSGRNLVQRIDHFNDAI